MYETPYAVLEPDTAYPKPEIGGIITLRYEKSEGAEPQEITMRIEQILFDAEGWAKVRCRTTTGGCVTTAFYRHTHKKSGRYHGRVVISDDCSP